MLFRIPRPQPRSPTPCPNNPSSAVIKLLDRTTLRRWASRNRKPSTSPRTAHSHHSICTMSSPTTEIPIFLRSKCRGSAVVPGKARSLRRHWLCCLGLAGLLWNWSHLTPPGHFPARCVRERAETIDWCPLCGHHCAVGGHGSRSCRCLLGSKWPFH
jgi:hypothetical protein